MKSKVERKVKFGDILNPSECFGQIELLRNCRRLNSVVCVEDAQILILNKSDFFECIFFLRYND